MVSLSKKSLATGERDNPDDLFSVDVDEPEASGVDFIAPYIDPITGDVFAFFGQFHPRRYPDVIGF